MAGDPSTPPDAPRGPFSLQKASYVWDRDPATAFLTLDYTAVIRETQVGGVPGDSRHVAILRPIRSHG